MALMGYVAKHGYRFATQAAGVPQVSSEKSDLMTRVSDGATRPVSGSAKKEESAKEPGDKLRADRAGSREMVEPATFLGKIREKPGMDGIVMALLPAAFLGTIAARKLRRRPSKLDGFASLAMQDAGDSEPHDMQFAVQGLGAEDFELLVALICQRHGYRVSMPEGLSGGRGGDFVLARKAERLLVQCKRLANEHRVAVERVREFHEAMVTAGFTRGLYVASCGYSRDAGHFARTNGITLISGKTLDQLITTARENPDEDLLAIAQWAPKFLQKLTLTPALCPTCEASMEEVVANGQTVWVCSQRPDCKGRRSARKRRVVPGAAAPKANPAADKPAAAPAKAKPPSEAKIPTPAPARPPSSRRANLPRIVSKRVLVRIPELKPAPPTLPTREPAPPTPEAMVPAPEAAPEDGREWPSASLKSVVPRQRPVVRRSQSGPSAFSHRGHSPASAMEGKTLPKTPANAPDNLSRSPAGGVQSSKRK